MKKFILLFLLFPGLFASKSFTDLISQNLNNSVEYNYNFTEGTKNKLIGNKNQAILYFIRCIEINPNSSAALFQLSEIYASNNDLRNAIKLGKRAYYLDKKNHWYLLHLAKLYQNTESLDTTIYLYKQLINLFPLKDEYYLNLSFLFFKNNQPQKAIKLLVDYQNKYFVKEDILITLFQIYKYIHDDKNSLKVLHIALNKFPDETRFYGLIAEHYLSVQQMDSSLFYYNKLLSIEPNNDRVILSLIEYYKANLDTTNVEKYSLKYINNPEYNFSEKLELLTSFINDNKYRQKYYTWLKYSIDTLISGSPEFERLYLLKVDFCLRSNDLNSAKNTLIYLVSNFKANYLIWEQLLFTTNSLGLYNELSDYANKCVTLFSDKPLPYFFMGLAYFNLKEYQNCIDILTRGLKFIKQSKELSIQFHTFLGESYQFLADYTKSEFHFEKVLQFDPQNISVLNNYSYYLALRNVQLEKALSYIQICIKKFPNSSTYLDTYGWILYKKGEINSAKIAIEKAIQNGGANNIEIIEHYCEILYYNGDKTNAIKFYKILEDNGKLNLPLKKLLEIE